MFKRTTLIWLTLIAGCAQQHWERPGATQQEFYVDQGQCKAQAFANTMNTYQVAIIFNGCMQGKGWYLSN